ncbi:MAG: class I SAM-dependent methyltransferase [Planctomycetota bacterium]
MEELESMEAAWDRMSVDYAERLQMTPRDERFIALAAEIEPSAQPLSVLDLGCGLGFELDAIFERLPNAQVTAVDISEKMLARMMERLSPFAHQITSRYMSYVDLNEPMDTYDIAISSLTVHHLPHATKLDVFRKVIAALRPGGVYLECDEFASPAKEELGQRWFDKRVAHREGAERGDWNHNMMFTIEHEVAVLKEAGFVSVRAPWQDVDADGTGMAVLVGTKPGA